jgi:hypothetical protein
MRSDWFAVGISDEAAFNIVLSNSAAHFDQLRGVGLGQKGLETEKYHLIALRSINQRLTQHNLEVTDNLIGAVAGFICHNVSISIWYARSVVDISERISLATPRNGAYMFVD